MTKPSDNALSSGGKGEPAPEDEIVTPRHTRASLNLIKRAVEKGWNIPQDWIDRLPAIAAKIATGGGNDRDRLRALEVLKAMLDSRINAAIALDKIERLDGGKPTDITTTFNVKVPGTHEDES